MLIKVNINGYTKIITNCSNGFANHNDAVVKGLGKEQSKAVRNVRHIPCLIPTSVYNVISQEAHFTCVG